MPDRKPMKAGDIFDRLTVISQADPKVTPMRTRIYRVNVRCECGTECVVYESKLRYGSTRSCGCLSSERVIARNKSIATHRMTRTKPYVAWQTMRDRCSNPKAMGFQHYGGRGIRVCAEWQHSFEAFLQDMGPGAPHLTLDRIDPNGNYEPSNCRWATWKEQETNRRNNRFVVVNGSRMCVSDAARVLGISISTIGHRAKRLGIDYQDAADFFLHKNAG